MFTLTFKIYQTLTYLIFINYWGFLQCSNDEYFFSGFKSNNNSLEYRKKLKLQDRMNCQSLLLFNNKHFVILIGLAVMLY